MVYPKPTAPVLVGFLFFILLGIQSQAAIYRSLGVGIMSWPEVVEIKDPTGTRYDATAQFYTPSIHYGIRNYRTKDGILFEAYGMYGSADIQAPGGITYFQKRVPFYGAGAAVGWFLRPEGKQVNFGVSFPIQYRHANWTNPPDGGTVTKKDQYAVGTVLDARWRLTPRFAINQRVGAFFGQESALWMLNIEWTLN